MNQPTSSLSPGFSDGELVADDWDECADVQAALCKERKMESEKTFNAKMREALLGSAGEDKSKREKEQSQK
jgi:hypothetical protein